MTTDRTPDPVDLPALIAYLNDPVWEHHQIPEQQEWWGTRGSVGMRSRSVGCTAHSEGQNCCLDYFYDTIKALVADQAQALALAWNQGHLAASEHGDLNRPGNQNPYEETP